MAEIGSTEFPSFDLVDHRQHINQNRRKLANEESSLLFQGYGTHYVNLWCGTPPQKQALIVDTGSDTVGFPGSSCVDCGSPQYHVSALFNESASSTFFQLPCRNCLAGSCKKETGDRHGVCAMRNSYQEGSKWLALEAADFCFLGGPTDATVPVASRTNPITPKSFGAFLKFGLQKNVTGLFRTQIADGIMGLDVSKSSFWFQLWENNAIERRAFSLCFLDSQTKQTAGLLTLGGTNENIHQQPMVFTPHKGFEGSGYYDVEIRRLYLMAQGTRRQEYPNPVALRLTTNQIHRDEPAVVDSGTTDTYFSKSAKAEFVRQFEKIAGRKFTNEYVPMTREEVDALPSLMIQLVGHAEKNIDQVALLAKPLDPDHARDVLLEIPARRYMEPDLSRKDGTILWSARILFDEPKGAILGANVMSGHEVLFDIEENVIGWTPSNCDVRSSKSEVLPLLPSAPGAAGSMVLLGLILSTAILVFGYKLRLYRPRNSKAQQSQ